MTFAKNRRSFQHWFCLLRKTCVTSFDVDNKVYSISGCPASCVNFSHFLLKRCKTELHSSYSFLVKLA